MSTGTTPTVITVNPSVPFQNSKSLFATSPTQLLEDLFRAYKDARKNKRSKLYQLQFEINSERELVRLRDSLLTRKYHPGRSSCFIIHEPKMREVFAAEFRDRVVHHLLYNYIASYLEKTFIEDSYSCIKGRGTHFGISRLEEHILAVSKNFSRPCFILKLDIKGYFMHINRAVLLDMCLNALRPFRELMDWPLVEYLLRETILFNPVKACHIVGSYHDWECLPFDKSLFHSPSGCGLPIGNVTSQLFSNVYMNAFDQYLTSNLGISHYGRYVDDAYVVASSRNELRQIIPIAEKFLKSSLGLTLNRNKTAIFSAYKGVEFLGAYLKPFRKYISSSSLRRMESRQSNMRVEDVSLNRINSYLGITSHYYAYNIRIRWVDGPFHYVFSIGYFTNHLLKAKVNRFYVE